MSYEANDELYSDSLSMCTNDYKLHIQQMKQYDRGYNTIYRTIDGKRHAIELYSSGDIGSNIRNAETGEYYDYIVGSANQDLFFSVKLATGEFTSANKSGALFYLSPKHCMSHLHSNVNDRTVANWEAKRELQLKVINKLKKNKAANVVIR